MEGQMKVMLVLEGGRVRRLHTVPLIQHYDVAQHSWAMAVWMMALNPEASPNLMKAVLIHDVGERYVGDLPAPAKWLIPDVALALKEAEAKALGEMGIGHIELTEEEREWLRAVDLFELYMFCVEEQRMGNRNVNPVRNTCHDLIWAESSPPWVAIQKWCADHHYVDRQEGGWIG